MSSITLYTARIAPFAQRVAIALVETQVEFKSYEIDLLNKPEWFTQKVNPAGKVPAIVYGGPDVPPEDPSPESVKLAESLILVEFVADLFPGAGLLPADAIQRAQARFFADVVNNKFVEAYRKFVKRGEGYHDILEATEEIQNLLPDSGLYALGEQFTIADIALAPFVGRLNLLAENDVGKYPVGKGPEFFQALQDPKYAKFNAYTRRLLERPSFQATFDSEYIKAVNIVRLSSYRNE